VNPEAPLALRLSGQLMLGVVRIYNRKVSYLFQDCSEALVKIKGAFAKERADLPEGGAVAVHNVITLPENYDDLEEMLLLDPVAVAAMDPANAVDRMGLTRSGENRGTNGAGNRADINLEDDLEEDMYDDFEHQYAHDDRIHDDGVGSDLEDVYDDAFYPSSAYKTPNGAKRDGDAAITDPDARADVQLEDYDDAGDGAEFGGGGDDDGAVGMEQVAGGMDGIEPLPLDDDLEDENGVRGTVVTAAGAAGVTFKTPSAAGAPPPNENDPPNTNASSGIVVDWGKTAQKGRRPTDVDGLPGAAVKPAPQARPRTKPREKLIIDDVTVLSNEHIRNQLKDTSDIVRKRTPGALRLLVDPRDTDVPFDHPDDVDVDGLPTVGYFKEGWTCVVPEEASVAHDMIRGDYMDWDPVMNHRMSPEMAKIRRACVAHLWKRAGEKWGGGYAAGDAAAAAAKGSTERGGGGFGFDDDGGDFGGGGGGFDDDDDFAMPPRDDDDFNVDERGTSRLRADAENAADVVDRLGPLGSEPPTPANAPKGDIDWSVHTKRMLSDLAPRLNTPRAKPVKVSEMLKDVGTETKPCTKSEAARVFYQVLVLKTHGFVELAQREDYGDIDIAAGPKMKDVAKGKTAKA